MIKTRTAVHVFSLFVALALIASYTIWSTLQRSVPGDTHRYAATFDNVLGLRTGDDVRMAGVRVGRVDAIDFDPNRKARVQFRIQSRQHLTTATKAAIRYQNLIGQRYVALLPGTGGVDPLPPGGAIPLGRTESSFDVSTLLAGFEPLFSVLQPDDVNSLSETLVQALQGDNVSLSALITQAAGLASTFKQRDDILGAVITNLSGVVAGLANRSGELETLITQSRALVTGLYEQGEALKPAVEQVSASTTQLADLIAQVAPGMAQAQRYATTGVDLLLANGSRLDQAAVELPYVLAGLARISGNGTYINSYVCGLDVSLWGVLFPRGLFSRIGGNAHSEVCR
ncbi:MlaD family protein [Nocardia mexicana]|uniref:Phospholipid/cholesterol/gamma-HCH transport system substrate-binding protein n=1 Tax=Nocardia mexicana TaxID=279262 RepID=A0A370GNG7_9NOCA|nr:MlaD family protein [Nocardia mexicana]RDI45268.1 phospholipid/cholesterol/gamma-HCH transport system substrate-binding protein [Nocardia mexicana]